MCCPQRLVFHAIENSIPLLWLVMVLNDAISLVTSWTLSLCVVLVLSLLSFPEGLDSTSKALVSLEHPGLGAIPKNVQGETERILANRLKQTCPPLFFWQDFLLRFLGDCAADGILRVLNIKTESLFQKLQLWGNMVPQKETATIGLLVHPSMMNHHLRPRDMETQQLARMSRCVENAASL